VFDPELQGSYIGQCMNGLAEGKGIAVGTARYEGEFKGGRKHGQGIKTWPTGDRYEGEFKDDRKDGRGTYVWGTATPWSGQKYIGSYRDDMRDGDGTYEWPDGERYLGQWRKDAPIGPPTARLAAQAHDERVRLAAVSKPGLTVCREMRVGSVVRDWVRGTVEAVAGDKIDVKIVDAGQFEHRIKGVGATKGAVVNDWALMWMPCKP
ncbi:MAG: MORN repeat-containing protein, partial [Rhodospirillaceae bacterium]